MPERAFIRINQKRERIEERKDELWFADFSRRAASFGFDAKESIVLLADRRTPTAGPKCDCLRPLNLFSESSFLPGNEISCLKEWNPRFYNGFR